MKSTVSHLILLITLILVAYSQAQLKTTCKSNEILTPSGCFLSCADPSFKACPDAFIQIYIPSFCAYTKDGQYINYTFSCQACQNQKVVAVRSGACSCSNIKCGNDQYCENGQCLDIDRCAAITCLTGYDCVNGSCVAPNNICTNNDQCKKGYFCLNGKCLDQCAYIKCRSGYICFEGQCRFQCTNNLQCSANQLCLNGSCIISQVKSCPQPTPIKCKIPRPNQKTCPTLTFIREPDNLVCGVTAQGQLVDFPVECYACKQSNIVLYYNQTCDSLPPKAIYCKEPRPTQKTCPTLYFFDEPADLVCGLTLSGQYVDFPVQCYACKQKDIVLYYNTTCEKIQNLNCSLSHVDKCALIRCKENQKCIDGKCILVNDSCVSQKKISCCQPRPNQLTCPTLYFLVKPDNLVCGVTYDGIYVDFPVQCYACKQNNIAYYFNKTCDVIAQQQICPQGNDLCASIKCTVGYQCVSGNCVKQATPCTLLCTKGYHCQNQKCVPDNVDLCADVICIATKTCVNGECVDPVLTQPCNLLCIIGYHCQNGSCVPSSK